MSIRTNVFIDKLSITVPLPNIEWESATENLADIRESEYNLSPSISEKAYRQYHLAWNFDIPSRCDGFTKCLVQALPKNDQASYLRLEWNPSKAAADAFDHISSFILERVPSFSLTLPQMRITRADFTFDIFRMSIDSISAFTNSARTTTDVYRRKCGKINGFYLGTSSSNIRLLVYDKLYELSRHRMKTKTKTLGHRAYAPRKWTRIEFRLKDIGFAASISTLENKLAQYDLILLPKALEIPHSNRWRQFVDRCSAYTAQEALKCLAGKETRRHYREILRKNCIPDWYNSLTIWREGTAALEHIFAGQHH